MRVAVIERVVRFTFGFLIRLDDLRHDELRGVVDGQALVVPVYRHERRACEE